MNTMTMPEVAKTAEPLVKTDTKMLVFTVADTDECNKQILTAKLVPHSVLNSQHEAEKLIDDWALSNDIGDDVALDIEDYLEDLAYDIRHIGYAYASERFCFELTELQD